MGTLSFYEVTAQITPLLLIVVVIERRALEGFGATWYMQLLGFALLGFLLAAEVIALGVLGSDGHPALWKERFISLAIGSLFGVIALLAMPSSPSWRKRTPSA